MIRHSMQLKKRFGFKGKIILLIFLFSLIITVTLSLVLFQVLKNSLFDQLKDRLHNLSYLSSQCLDQEALTNLLPKLSVRLTPKELRELEFSEDFTRLTHFLLKIKNSDELILRIYIAACTEETGQVKYIATACTQNLIQMVEEVAGQPFNEIPADEIQSIMEHRVGSEELVHFGDKLNPQDYPGFHQAVLEKGVYVDEGDYNKNDEFSTVIAYAPIPLSSEYAASAYLVIEFSSRKITNSLEEAQNFAMIFGIGAVLFSLIISVFLGIYFTRSINILRKVVRRFSNKEFSARAPILSRDEVGELGENFNIMAKTIQNYQENLEELVAKRTRELDLLNLELTGNNQKFLKELKMAQRVQQNIIPKESDFPTLKELLFVGEYLAMDSVGGDLYDVIKIGKNIYGMVIADVSGHGVSASLISTMAKVSFYAYSLPGFLAQDICKYVNNDIYSFIGDLEYYLSACYGIINLWSGIFEYCNAGHPPPIIYNPDHRKIEKLTSNGPVLGVINDVEYTQNVVYLEEGDRILFFTDGIIEAKNEREEQYGYSRLTQFIENQGKLTGKRFVQELLKNVDSFCHGNPPDDDRAVLFIEFKSKITADKNIDDVINVESAKSPKENNHN